MAHIGYKPVIGFSATLATFKSAGGGIFRRTRFVLMKNYSVGQIIRNYYRDIDFSYQLDLKQKIMLRDEPYVYFIETRCQNTKPSTVFGK